MLKKIFVAGAIGLGLIAASFSGQTATASTTAQSHVTMADPIGANCGKYGVLFDGKPYVEVGLHIHQPKLMTVEGCAPGQPWQTTELALPLDWSNQSDASPWFFLKSGQGLVVPGEDLRNHHAGHQQIVITVSTPGTNDCDYYLSDMFIAHNTGFNDVSVVKHLGIWSIRGQIVHANWNEHDYTGFHGVVFLERKRAPHSPWRAIHNQETTIHGHFHFVELHMHGAQYRLKFLFSGNDAPAHYVIP